MKRVFIIIVFILMMQMIFSIEIPFVYVPSNNKVHIGNNEMFYYKDYAYKENPVEKSYFFLEMDIKLSEYEIAKYLVSYKQFSSFLEETNIKLKSLDNRYWSKFYDENKNDNKIFNLASSYDALMFCQWLGKKNNEIYRLPTNCEWEHACINGFKSQYPYGCPDGKFSSLEKRKVENVIFGIDEIKEDVSRLGVCGVFGSFQYVMDYIGKDDNSLNSRKNPLIFSADSSLGVRSGGLRYNENIPEKFGIFFHNIEFWGAESFSVATRLVKDLGTVFNEGTETECKYYQNRGYSLVSTLVYKIPSKTTPIVDTLEENQEFLTLFRTTDENMYRVYYIKNNEWKTGWITKDTIKITNKPWYKNPLYRRTILH